MRDIEKPLEDLGVKFWSTGHDYCEEHETTWDCYSPCWCFEHGGHEFQINRCHIQGKWVVWKDSDHHLVDDIAGALALVEVTP